METDTSDLDIVVLLGNASDEPAAARIARDWATSYLPLKLDILVSTAGQVSQRHPALIPHLLLHAKPLAGSKELGPLVLPPWPAYRHAVVHRSRAFMNRVRGYPPSYAGLPLDYPDSGGEFFGYDRVRITGWHPPGTTQSTRELVANASYAVAALGAVEAGLYCSSKRQSLLWGEQSLPESRALIETLRDVCLGRLEYRMPTTESDRHRLRLACRTMVDFENRVALSITRWL